MTDGVYFEKRLTDLKREFDKNVSPVLRFHKAALSRGQRRKLKDSIALERLWRREKRREERRRQYAERVSG